MSDTVIGEGGSRSAHRLATKPTTTGRVRIREADGEDDAYYIQRQGAHWFGAEYDSQETLSINLCGIARWDVPNDATPPIDSYGVVAEHCTQDGSVRIGGGVALLLDQKEATDKLLPGSFDASALATDPSVWFLLGFVDQAWRGRGIGRRIFQRRLRWAKQTEAEVALSLGWERDGRSSRPLFEQSEWVPVETIESGYADSNRTACPDCGVWQTDEGSCQCDATVWAVDLPG
jgi:GNAT superfamily N-acetyltransferase